METRLLREVIRRLSRIEGKLGVMAEREEAAYARQAELIQLVRDGSEAKDAKIRVLQQLVDNAQEITDQAVQDALNQDSEFDAERIEAGNTALSELASRPAELLPNRVSARASRTVAR